MKNESSTINCPQCGCIVKPDKEMATFEHTKHHEPWLCDDCHPNKEECEECNTV